MYSYTPKNGTNSGCDLTVEVVGEGFKTQYNYEAIDYEMTIGRKLRKDLFLKLTRNTLLLRKQVKLCYSTSRACVPLCH